MVAQRTKETLHLAYSEVITILSYLPDEYWNKIPKEKRDFYFENMEKSYKFKLDFSKPINEQKIMKETQIILGNLYKRYLATDEEKQNIAKEKHEEFLRIEEEKRKKYNPDNIFKKKSKTTVVNNPEINLPVEVKQYSIFQKLFNYIKNYFKNVLGNTFQKH
ncbi:MAG: hypothetical protein ACI4UE_02730 [Candidatus Scatovivens sp.]